jgi:hypothetical protein
VKVGETLDAPVGGDARDEPVVVRHLERALHLRDRHVESLGDGIPHRPLADADAHLREDEAREVAGFVRRAAVEQPEQRVYLRVLAARALTLRERREGIVDAADGQRVGAARAERAEALLAAELVARRDRAHVAHLRQPVLHVVRRDVLPGGARDGLVARPRPDGQLRLVMRREHPTLNEPGDDREFVVQRGVGPRAGIALGGGLREQFHDEIASLQVGWLGLDGGGVVGERGELHRHGVATTGS